MRDLTGVWYRERQLATEARAQQATGHRLPATMHAARDGAAVRGDRVMLA